MRISELLENKRFEESDFIEHNGDKRKINYDLIEDLVYFMNNDDDIYRHHLYPSIIKCVHNTKSNKPISANIFQNAVIESYNSYVQNFPIRELPNKLSRRICEKICEKIYNNVLEDINNGKYND